MKSIFYLCFLGLALSVSNSKLLGISRENCPMGCFCGCDTPVCDPAFQVEYTLYPYNFNVINSPQLSFLGAEKLQFAVLTSDFLALRKSVCKASRKLEQAFRKGPVTKETLQKGEAFKTSFAKLVALNDLLGFALENKQLKRAALRREKKQKVNIFTGKPDGVDNNEVNDPDYYSRQALERKEEQEKKEEKAKHNRFSSKKANIAYRQNVNMFEGKASAIDNNEVHDPDYKSRQAPEKKEEKAKK